MPEGFIKPYPSLFKQSLIRVRNSVNPVKITRTQYPLAQKDWKAARRRNLRQLTFNKINPKDVPLNV
jgi:hypothetical protein